MAVYSLDNIDAWLDRVFGAGGDIDQAYRKLCLDMFSSVVYMSPVKSGRFLGNWQCAIGNAPSGSLLTTDQHGAATMARISGVINRLRAGETIYLVNNLVYAVPLEYGHSNKAPNGMVRVTVARFQDFVNRSVVGIRARP